MNRGQKALEQLKLGNQRYVNNHKTQSRYLHNLKRDELKTGQNPFAVILGCSDSRVPAEIVFDQGLGDLFVIRVAGNIVAPSQIGSVEFALGKFNTPLVVVLGHSQCGAITATIDQLNNPGEESSINLHSIVNRIRPYVEALIEAGLGKDTNELIEHAVRANIRSSVNQLRSGSVIIEKAVIEEELTIVGAEYSLETGVVDFFYNI